VTSFAEKLTTVLAVLTSILERHKKQDVRTTAITVSRSAQLRMRTRDNNRTQADLYTAADYACRVTVISWQ